MLIFAFQYMVDYNQGYEHVDEGYFCDFYFHLDLSIPASLSFAASQEFISLSLIISDPIIISASITIMPEEPRFCRDIWIFHEDLCCDCNRVPWKPKPWHLVWQV